jgi:D-beta-D-heptose 7-phosphate kinase/D-beta-D-heptose 1-phosphate adenosyltransferase
MDTQLPASFNVLLIGDTCIDEYRIGTVDRLSPEAPVPVIKLIEEYTVPGMASNVEENLKKLGINADFIHNKEKIIKTRYLDKRSGQHLLRVDSEPDITSWDETLPNPLSFYDAIVISDYNKGFLSYENIERIIKESSCPVFIDTKKQDLSRFHGAYVKINETEYKARYSMNDNLIVTLGAQGAMFKNYHQEEFFPTHAADVVDVCGCGDTFLAALVFQFLMTNQIKDAIVFANRAASITVQHQGNYAPTLEEINA